MKRIRTELTGGYPFTEDDLTYIQDNVRETTSSIAKGLALGNAALRIEGISYTLADLGTAEPKAIVEAGTFWYFDEVFAFEATTITMPVGYEGFEFITNYFFDLYVDLETPVLFKDGNAKEVDEIRTAVLTLAPTSWAGLNYINVPSFTDAIESLVPDATTSEPGVVQLANDLGTINAFSNTTAVTPEGLNAKVPHITKSFEIVDWNMDDTDIINIPVNIPSTDIRSVSIMILSDSTNTYDFLNGGSHLTTSAGIMTLTRTIGGIFDTVSFSATGTTRGWVTVSYIF